MLVFRIVFCTKLWVVYRINQDVMVHDRLALPVAIWAIGHMALDLAKQKLPI